MRILFVTHYFPPEELSMAFLIQEFADFMATRGHNVDVLTGFPNWPKGTCYAGYNSKKMILEKMGKVDVFRIPFFASPNGSLLRRMLDFTSFELAVKKYGKKLRRPDIIYVHVPPNEDALAALHLANYFNCKCIVNIQDMHPDGAIKLGYIKNPIVIKMLRYQERRMLANALHITVIGENFKEHILAKGISADKISVIPNWIDSHAIIPMDRINDLRAEWKIAADRFVILYAGTFGRVHNTSILLEAAKILDGKTNALFLLVGQGYDFRRNQELINKLGLKNVIMRAFVPRSRLSELQAISDISVVTLRHGFGYTSVPSKVLGYMSAGRGVIGLVDNSCDTAVLIRAANCGVVHDPDDVQSFVQELLKISANPSITAVWGRNARQYILENLEAQVVLANGAELIESM